MAGRRSGRSHRAASSTAACADPSRIAGQLALLDHPLVRLGRALDAVLPVVALAREDLRHLEDTARAAAAIRPGGIKHGLADLESVIAQSHSPCCRRDPQPAAAGRTPLLLVGFMSISTTETGRKGDYLRGIVAVRTADRDGGTMYLRSSP